MDLTSTQNKKEESDLVMAGEFEQLIEIFLDNGSYLEKIFNFVRFLRQIQTRDAERRLLLRFFLLTIHIIFILL